MRTPDLGRRLATIMFADMVGYSAMVSADEDHAKSQRERMRAVLDVHVQENQGNIIQYYGDGALVSFHSAIHAVDCAGSIQDELQREPKVALRIGLHMGEVLFEENGVFGDVVNIASRIESMAIPGSVLLSEKVWTELLSHRRINTRALGSYFLKNIPDPVQLFAIDRKGVALPAAGEIQGKGRHILRKIAVLPFVNMSSDRDNEYFSDGITEEILNALVPIKGLKVTSRTSSFAFKNTNLAIKVIADELGVDVVLEGSVRKFGDQVRITAQLIDAIKDVHIWSETFDRDFGNVFEIQDEISEAIALKMKGLLGDGVAKGVVLSSGNEEAVRMYLKGRYHLGKMTPPDALLAIEFFERAEDLDASFAPAVANRAITYAYMGLMGSIRPRKAFEDANKCADKASRINDGLALNYVARAMIALFYNWDPSKSDRYISRAKEIGTNDYTLYLIEYMSLVTQKRISEAHSCIMEALIQDPLNPMLRHFLAQIHFYNNDYHKSLEMTQGIIEQFPDFRISQEFKAFILLEKGEPDQALHEIAKYQQSIGNPLHGVAVLGYFYARTGNREGAMECMRKLDMRKERELEQNLNFDYAILHLVLDNYEQAIDYLEKCAIDRVGMILFLDVSFIDWHVLRGNERYEALRKRIGISR